MEGHSQATAPSAVGVWPSKLYTTSHNTLSLTASANFCSVFCMGKTLKSRLNHCALRERERVRMCQVQFLLQYARGCLDVALQLLQGLSADDRRSAATVTKCIVAQVHYYLTYAQNSKKPSSIFISKKASSISRSLFQ